MHNILLHSQAFGHSKTDLQLRICTLFRLTDSLRANSPFWGYREKETRESLSRLRSSLVRSRVACFARPNKRACLQANS